MKKFIGIDVSKATFSVALPQTDGGYQVEDFPNNEEGISTLLPLLDRQAQCVMEATGSYSMLLSYTLSEQGYTVSVINPRQAAHFSQMLLRVTKTDRMDAILLAKYGQHMQPPAFQPNSKTMLHLKQKRALLKQLKKQKMALICLQEAHTHQPTQDEDTQRTTHSMLKAIEQHQEKVEQSLYQTTQQAYADLMKIVTSVKGIGKEIATALIVTTGGFTRFTNAKQLAKFIGICPTHYQSGSSVNGKSTIARRGDPHLRSLLYMASLSAIRHNQACKELYDRLKAKGKASKVALIAVANKLIRQVFALISSKTMYQDGYTSKHPAREETAQIA
jgi:transposase